MATAPAREPVDARSHSSELRHDYLSFLEDTAQSLGAMAPAGTLGVVIPLLIARGGNGTWLAFLVTLVAFLLVCFCVSRFAQYSASAGAFATYAELGLGRRAGVTTGWAYVIAMMYGVASAAPSAAYYADVFLTEVTGTPGTALRGAILTVIVILVSWLVSFRDIKLSTKIMLALELATLAVMLGVVALAMRHTHAWIDPPQMRLDGAHFASFQLTLVFGFMTLAGFETVTTLGEESTNATRTIPRVILCNVVPIGLLYLVMIYCLISIARKIGLDLGTLDAPFDGIARAIHLPALGYISSLGIALSYFACTLAQLNAGARVLYHLAQENMFAPRFGEAHPRNHTPHRALALLSIIGVGVPLGMMALHVTLIDVVNYVTQLTSFGFIASYFMVCLALPFYLRRKGILRPVDSLFATGAMIILGIVLLLSVFPIPTAPWLYLPYIFAATLAAGLGISYYFSRRAVVQT
ncbi:MAG: APC family permease [Candidatus Acidiferrales bacterium]